MTECSLIAIPAPALILMGLCMMIAGVFVAYRGSTKQDFDGIMDEMFGVLVLIIPGMAIFLQFLTLYLQCIRFVAVGP